MLPCLGKPAPLSQVLSLLLHMDVGAEPVSCGFVMFVFCSLKAPVFLWARLAVQRPVVTWSRHFAGGQRTPAEPRGLALVGSQDWLSVLPFSVPITIGSHIVNGKVPVAVDTLSCVEAASL